MLPVNQVRDETFQTKVLISFRILLEFVEKRRAALERYLNRTASHPNLRVDPDFR